MKLPFIQQRKCQNDEGADDLAQHVMDDQHLVEILIQLLWTTALAAHQIHKEMEDRI